MRTTTFGWLRNPIKAIADWRHREKRRKTWESSWGRDDFSPKWANRGIAPEIVEAVETGWLPARGPVLDIGCGLGEIAVWFAQRGYETLGFDIAEAAIRKACEAHAPMPPTLQFMAHDACAKPPPDLQYRILIDRGCLHQIPRPLVSSFARNIAAVAAPDARMILLMRAFRGKRPFADPDETAEHVHFVRETFRGMFDIERHAAVYMDRHLGAKPDEALPGLVFWMTATPRA